jgi:hypothetical protein
MENLVLAATKYTPDVLMQIDGTISLKGKSYPENTFEFYKPVIEWLKTYFETESSPKVLTVNIEITYFNSSSSKLFFDFFDLLNDAPSDFKIIINWLYNEENESALEAGEDFIDDFSDLTIHLVPTE